ncbi:MAG: NUDIX hydrolase [Anaerolineales bacterium]
MDMSLSADDYTVIESRVLLDHPLVRVVADTLEHGARRAPYFYLESPVDSVATVALTAERQIILTRQYRHPIRAVIYDLPAGRLKSGEDPADGARRELEEETGYHAGSLTPLGRYNPFPGSLKVTAHLFLAHDLTYVGQQLDTGEDLEIALLPFEEVLHMVLRGEYLDGSLQLGVLLAAATRKGLIA